MKYVVEVYVKTVPSVFEHLLKYPFPRSQMNEARYGYETRCYEGAPAFERYDPAQCPQRSYGWEDDRYHDPHLPTPMKTDQSEQETNSGPIYPRYVLTPL